MTPDDDAGSAFLTVGALRQPAMLLAVVSLMIMTITWLVVSAGDLTIPAAWVDSK